MNTLTTTDARRFTHLLEYVFNRDHFFELPFTSIEFSAHMIWEEEMER